MVRKRSSSSIGFFGFLAFLLVLSSAGSSSVAAGDKSRTETILKQFRSFSSFPPSASWKETAAKVQTIRINSSADGSSQPALYYDSGTDRARPLLVVLHSWSDNYTQKYSIPYAVWSMARDWVFIHPDYRGIFNNASATGSELAARDVLDAVDFALANAKVDKSRIYLAGFSGGAMMALNMAGRNPERWSAVAAWVPIFNITDWYRYVIRFPDRHYARHIVASCGGAPSESSAAADECNGRSPSTHLKRARGKSLPIYISHGVHDDFAPPEHSLRAFNELADEKDTISKHDIELINSKGTIPPHLASTNTDQLYQEAGKPLLFRRASGSTTISLFEGGHDVLYLAGLQWLSEQNRETK